MKPFIFYLAILLAAGVTSCSTGTAITARPDPDTSTSGTLGSVKATDGVIPLGQSPHTEDTTIRHR
jgi:hypothetical protein